MLGKEVVGQMNTQLQWVFFCLSDVNNDGNKRHGMATDGGRRGQLDFRRLKFCQHSSGRILSSGHRFVPCPISQGIISMFSGLFKVTQAGLELRLGHWTLNSRPGVPFSESSMQAGDSN